eukprot:4919263-Amphidinium_carterae.1
MKLTQSSLSLSLSPFPEITSFLRPSVLHHCLVLHATNRLEGVRPAASILAVTRNHHHPHSSCAKCLNNAKQLVVPPTTFPSISIVTEICICHQAMIKDASSHYRQHHTQGAWSIFRTPQKHPLFFGVFFGGRNIWREPQIVHFATEFFHPKAHRSKCSHTVGSHSSLYGSKQ